MGKERFVERGFGEHPKISAEKDHNEMMSSSGGGGYKKEAP